MRVKERNKWQLGCCVASHMGSCQPGRATTPQHARTINAHRISVQALVRSTYREVMAAQTFLGTIARAPTPVNAPPGQALMAVYKKAAPPHYAQTREQNLRDTEHPLAVRRISAEVQVRVISMSGERRGPRGRGGSRGRPPTQRRATPPASSEEDPWVHSGHLQRSIHRQFSQEPRECGHTEHPAIKYRIPCTFADNTLIVSVTMEHCSDASRQRDSLTVPRLDMEVPKVDFRYPPQTKEASTSTIQPARTQEGGNQPVLEANSTEPRPVKEDEPYETDDE